MTATGFEPTDNHLVPKQTLNYLTSLAKWLSVCLGSNWLWVGSNPVAVTLTLAVVPVSNKELLDIQVTIKCVDSL